MAKDFSATITDPERAAEWEALLGTTTVHITSPIPTPASLPGHPQAFIYELDLNLITGEQRQRLIQHFHLKFGMPKDIIMQTLDDIGVPILANDCIIAIQPTHKNGHDSKKSTGNESPGAGRGADGSGN